MPTYIIRAGGSGPVKIGRADDPSGRLRELQTGHHEVLEIIRIIDTPFDTESQFHKRFAEYRLRGEWFDFTPSMLTFVPEEMPLNAPLKDIIENSRIKAARQIRDLLLEMHSRTKGVESRGEFIERTARLLGFRKWRVKKLFYGERLRIEVAEMEGVKALAAKLEFEEPRAEGTPPLFRTLEGQIDFDGGK